MYVSYFQSDPCGKSFHNLTSCLSFRQTLRIALPRMAADLRRRSARPVGEGGDPVPVPLPGLDNATPPGRPINAAPTKGFFLGRLLQRAADVFWWVKLAGLFLIAAFIIPHVYYANTRIAKHMVPNVSSSAAWDAFLDTPPVLCARDQCCLTIGPVIGAVTDTTARVLVEATQSRSLALVLTEVVPSTASPAPSSAPTPTAPKPHKVAVTVQVTANRPAVFAFTGLRPSTQYTVGLDPVPAGGGKPCASRFPALAAALGGGLGLVKTRASGLLLAIPTHDSALDAVAPTRHSPVPDSVEISNSTAAASSSPPVATAAGTAARAGGSNGAVNGPSEAVRVAVISCNNILHAWPTAGDLWRHLAARASQIDVALHIGDQVYSDSKRQGPLRNTFLQIKEVLTAEIHKIVGPARAAVIPRDVLFDKAPPPFALLSPLVPQAARDRVAEMYRDLYRTTWAYPAAHVALATMPGIFLLDDHDIFDDLFDVPADVDVRSLRRLVIDIGLAIYAEYQHSLNTAAPLDLAPQFAARYPPRLTNAEEVAKAVESLMATGTRAQAPVGTVHAPATTGKTWTFVALGDVCVAMLDTRLQRDSGRFAGDKLAGFKQTEAPWTYDTITGAMAAGWNITRTMTSTVNTAAYKPSALLGPQQWSDLEEALSDVGAGGKFARCSALFVASSVPFVYLSSSINGPVAHIHDDMLGHWAGPDYKDEQIRIFDALIEWRLRGAPGTGAGGAMRTREVLLIGGDIHTGGFVRMDSYKRSGLGAVASWSADKEPLWQMISSTIHNDPLVETLLVSSIGSNSLFSTLSVLPPPFRLDELDPVDKAIEGDLAKLADATTEHRQRLALARRERERAKLDKLVPAWSRRSFVFDSVRFVRERNYGLVSLTRVASKRSSDPHARVCMRGQLVRGDEKGVMEDAVIAMSPACPAQHIDA